MTVGHHQPLCRPPLNGPLSLLIAAQAGKVRRQVAVKALGVSPHVEANGDTTSSAALATPGGAPSWERLPLAHQGEDGPPGTMRRALASAVVGDLR